MSLGFLKICGPLQVGLGIAKTLTASGEVTPLRYRQEEKTYPQCLLIEGMNQFAVRLGRHILQTLGQGTDRVLPVVVRSFECGRLEPENVYDVMGEALPFGNTAIIRMEARVLTKPSEEPAAIAQAEVIVAPVPDPIGNAASCDELPKPISLISAPPGTSSKLFDTDVPVTANEHGVSIQFSINPYAAILKEHFPERPVVPGSLIVDFVCGFTHDSNIASAVRFGVEHLRFVQPLLPGERYVCRIIQRTRLSFTIENLSARLVAAGSLFWTT